MNARVEAAHLINQLRDIRQQPKAVGYKSVQALCHEAADMIKRLAAADSVSPDSAEAVAAENTRLRAALAQSDQPCAYCSLSREDWAKCQHGFPGCDRADDAMGCPELGARLHLNEAVAAERERCAKFVERWCHEHWPNQSFDNCADALRKGAA